MTNEEAIAFLSQYIDNECYTDKCRQANRMAIAALRSAHHSHKTTKMIPLTLEQLRGMGGQPVWIVEYPDWGHWELSEDGEDYIEDRDPDLYGLRHDDPEGKFGLHKLGWLAYAYPPARIDREAWEPCGYCAGAKYVYGHASAVTPNGDKGQIETELEGDFDYCPECGRPLTPEAWAELEKRLRG